MARFWIALGAAQMLLALIIAAATGHRLEGQWAPIVRDAFDTAREMQFVHGLKRRAEKWTHRFSETRRDTIDLERLA